MHIDRYTNVIDPLPTDSKYLQSKRKKLSVLKLSSRHYDIYLGMDSVQH